MRPDVVAEYASFDFLLPPEEAIFSRFADRIEGKPVLDIGVGAGRTTTHLGSRARRYVGTDISEAMIEACRIRFSGQPGTSFRVLDACDMRALADESFDFVMFSFNGLDLVGDHSRRLVALTEMTRVCRPGGVVAFSTENLCFVEERLSYLSSALAAVGRSSGRGLRRRWAAVRSAVANSRMWRRLNPGRGALARVEHAMISEERPPYELSPDFYERPNERIRVERYFIRPAAQVRQLEEVGLTGIRVLDPDGQEVTDQAAAGLAHRWWLYFAAVKKVAP